MNKAAFALQEQVMKMFINIYNLFTLLKGFKSFASYLENWINLIKKDKKENNLDFYNEILMMEGF